jgi:hypothetical protein
VKVAEQFPGDNQLLLRLVAFLAVLFLPVDFFAAGFLAVFFEPDFRVVDLFAADFLVVDLRLDFFAAFFADFFVAFLALLREGTFAPDSRASLIAMAIACLRLFTLSPLLDLSLPSLCSFITSWILRSAFLEYFAMIRLV